MFSSFGVGNAYSWFQIFKSIHGEYTWLPPPSLVSRVLPAPFCYMLQITTVFSFLYILLEITWAHTSERLLLWAMCYIRIRDLWGRGFQSWLRDEAWLLGIFLCSKVLLKYNRDRESFWHRHQKGTERLPPCWLFSKVFYVSWWAANQIRKTPQGWGNFTRPLSHNMHFWDRMAPWL